MPELPTGTVTFLFTDLEGSTRLWEEHSETMKAALARHDEILRDAVESHGGHIVKTTGDGVHAAFADPAGALTAAVTAQQGLVEAAMDPPMRVRMGIHTGPAEVRDGDYYGNPVNRAARLMSAAHGGQIVVSLATEELARDHLPGGAALVDLGEHRLRDLARPERLFQLVVPGLPSEFPPLRSLETLPSNLPAQLTTFVGREEELTGIGDALQASRLVTITGVGGVGKTRLALQVAAEVLPRFPDGAWLCELAVADDAESMAQIIASTFGVHARAGLTLEASICEFLRPKTVLVVLDNCEHLMRPARTFATSLLNGCPGVRILATTREALGVAGEQIWPLRSLDVPDTSSVDEIAGSEAAVLFAERARAVRPGFTIDESNASYVADICQRLDGIPLALELAAARVVAMSPRDIAARLDERFRLLTGGRNASVERHQTLRAAVDWSYSLLEEAERTVLNRLAVFAGSFDAESAEAVIVGSGVESWDVVDALTGLVAKSMVLADEGATGTMRYQLLETMRQYAAERLDADGDIDVWRRRHAEHYANLSEIITQGLRGREETAWRSRLDVEVDNLRSAIAWGVGADADDDGELGLRVIAALSFESRWHRGVGIGAWAMRAVDRAERSSPDLRMDVLSAAAYVALTVGDHERSRELAFAALRDGIVARWSPDLAYITLCYGALATGHHNDVLRWMDEGRDALADAHEWSRISFMWTRASYLGMFEDPRAADEGREVVQLARRTGNPTAIANSLHCLGMALSRSSPDEALAAFEESTALLESSNDNLIGSALSTVSYLRARKRDRAGALAAMRGAIEALDRIGDRPQLAGAVNWAIVVLRRFDELEPAAVLVGVALDSPLSEVNQFPGALSQQRDNPLLTSIEVDLGSEAFRDLVARGAAMEAEDVVRFLLAELDRLIAETD
jgi:predicted ATPase/class 3 adenylate cyclase